MEKRSKKYLAVVLAVMFALLLVTAALNYCVDPYGIYSDWKKGDVYPASDTYIRIHKTERIKRLKPDAIVLGTSHADLGINPRPEFWPGLSPYNAALSAANIREQRRLLEFSQRVHPLKRVLITLDMFTFNAQRLENRHFEERRVAPNALDPINSLINTYGTLVSFDTLLVINKHFHYMRQLDRRSYPKPNGQKMHNEGAWRVAKFGAASIFWKSPNLNALGAKEFGYNYSDAPGDDTFHQFRAMLEFCEKNHIAVYLFFSPYHKSHLDLLKREGRWKLFEEWKQKVTAIVRETKYPLWDFATYNSFTTEDVPAKGDLKNQIKYFWDTDHYKEQVGDIMQRKVFGLAKPGEYPEFGTKLN